MASSPKSDRQSYKKHRSGDYHHESRGSSRGVERLLKFLPVPIQHIIMTFLPLSANKLLIHFGYNKEWRKRIFVDCNLGKKVYFYSPKQENVALMLRWVMENVLKNEDDIGVHEDKYKFNITTRQVVLVGWRETVLTSTALNCFLHSGLSHLVIRDCKLIDTALLAFAKESTSIQCNFSKLEFTGATKVFKKEYYDLNREDGIPQGQMITLDLLCFSLDNPDSDTIDVLMDLVNMWIHKSKLTILMQKEESFLQTYKLILSHFLSDKVHLICDIYSRDTLLDIKHSMEANDVDEIIVEQFSNNICTAKATRSITRGTFELYIDSSGKNLGPFYWHNHFCGLVTNYTYFEPKRGALSDSSVMSILCACKKLRQLQLLGDWYAVTLLGNPNLPELKHITCETSEPVSVMNTLLSAFGMQLESIHIIKKNADIEHDNIKFGLSSTKLPTLRTVEISSVVAWPLQSFLQFLLRIPNVETFKSSYLVPNSDLKEFRKKYIQTTAGGEEYVFSGIASMIDEINKDVQVSEKQAVEMKTLFMERYKKTTSNSLNLNTPECILKNFIVRALDPIW